MTMLYLIIEKEIDVHCVLVISKYIFKRHVFLCIKFDATISWQKAKQRPGECHGYGGDQTNPSPKDPGDTCPNACNFFAGLFIPIGAVTVL